ncbi:MAG: efflux transporter outer membrane subunit [Gammaproteobacteria bacterium]
MRELAAVFGAGLLVAGCAVGPDYRPPELQVPAAWPESAVLESPSEQSIGDWWRRFEDPVLDALVERALADNLDLRIQVARIGEARARLGLARAEQWPTVGIQAEATRRRTPAAAFGVEGFETPPLNLFGIAGVLGYEIDLWGRIARQREAAMAQLEGSLYATAAVRLGLITDVAVGYFGLRSAQRQMDIAERTLAARQEGVRVERLRYDAGMIDELSLRQAEVELAATRAELPVRIDELQRRETALGLLLGLDPAELVESLQVADGGLGDITLPDSVPAELPSALLSRRPDLRAAEAEVIAATAAIGVAQAARLPQLNLAASFGTAASTTGNLFTSDAEAWNIGGTLTGPLYDFGRGRARVDTAEALREQSELRYRATVARAFAEVRDALTFFASTGIRLDAVQEQVTALRRTEELAEIRYREGYISIIELLDAQRALLGAELALAQATSDRFAAAATLFKTLGGGWEGGTW